MKSLRDLDNRLALEAELVPCPNCHWINEDLVDGYRRGKFRSAGWTGLAFGFGGTVLSLICAWFSSMAPPIDRHLLPYFLYGGPVLSIALGLMIVLAAKVIRNSIQPNRNFPMPPRLPAGTPIPLIINQESGELQEAVRPANVVEDWQIFQIGRHQFPPECCLCLEPESSDHSIHLNVTSSLKLAVPRCVSCAGRNRRDFAWIWALVSSIFTLAMAFLCLILNLNSDIFWIVFGGLALISLAIGSYIAAFATWSVKFRVKDSSRGILSLRFRNHNYAARVNR